MEVSIRDNALLLPQDLGLSHTHPPQGQTTSRPLLLVPVLQEELGRLVINKIHSLEGVKEALTCVVVRI